VDQVALPGRIARTICLSGLALHDLTKWSKESGERLSVQCRNFKFRLRWIGANDGADRRSSGCKAEE
jgi:hypothetical protein